MWSKRCCRPLPKSSRRSIGTALSGLVDPAATVANLAVLRWKFTEPMPWFFGLFAATFVLVAGVGVTLLTQRSRAGGDRAARDHTTDIALMARSNVSRAVMGWSLTTAFLQPFGLMQSMARNGVGNVLSGVGRFMGTPKHMSETLAMIDEKSPMMRHRSKTMSRELYEISNIVRGKSKGMRVFDASLFYLTTKLQAIADVPTWLGAYNKALQEKPQDEQRAIDLADRAVIEAQGSGSNKDLAKVQRDHPFLTQFMSYFSAGYQIAVEKTKFTDFKNPRAVAGWAADMALLAILPAILPNLIMHLLRGGDADDPEKLAKEMAKWQAQFLLSPIVYARDASAITESDVHALRENGLSDAEISVRAAQYAGQVWTGFQRGRVAAMPSYRTPAATLPVIARQRRACVARSWL